MALGFVMYFSCVLLLEAGAHAGAVAYEGVARAAFGKRGALLVDVLVALGNTFTLVAYMILIGDFGIELLTLAFKMAPARHYVGNAL